MAVVNVLSTLLTNNDAATQTLNRVDLDGGRVRVKRASVSIANGDSANSTFRLARIKSNDSVIGVHIFNTALGGSCATDIGLYQTTGNGSAVVDADAYASAVAISSASTTGVNVAWESASRAVSKIGQRVWEDAGLTADPQREYDIVATLTADSAAAGTLAVLIFYVTD